MLSGGITTLRLAHVSEAASIARLSRQEVEHGLRWRWTPRRVRESIDNPETLVLVASASGELGGFAVMKFGEREAHLMLLAVDPAYRRSGVGSALFRWLERSCRTAGITHIRLEVRRANIGARRFYERLGFTINGHIPRYYDRRESALVLLRRVAPEVSGR